MAASIASQLAAARSVADASKRVTAILTIFDGLWKVNRANAASQMPAILEFQTDTSASVRKLLVKIIDQVIRELPENLAALLPHLTTMFSKVGEEQPILKQIVTSISTILPPVVKFMKDSPTKEAKSAWDSLIAFIGSVVAAGENDTLDSSGVQAAHKALETLITLASDEKWYKPHPFLDGRTLPVLATAHLDTLTSALEVQVVRLSSGGAGASDAAANTIAASLVTTLTSIALRIPALKASSRASLLSFHARLPSLPDPVRLPLRAGLFRLLEQSTPKGTLAGELDAELAGAVIKLGWAAKVASLTTPTMSAAASKDTPVPASSGAAGTISSPRPTASKPVDEDVPMIDVATAAPEAPSKPAVQSQEELFNTISRLPMADAISALLDNLKRIPLEPMTPNRSLAVSQAACTRMVNSGDLMQRCGGVVWPERRNALVCSLACDPLLRALDASVLGAGGSGGVASQETPSATPVAVDAGADMGDDVEQLAPAPFLPPLLEQYPDLVEEERITQITLQESIVKYVIGDFHTRKSLAFSLLSSLHTAALTTPIDPDDTHAALPSFRYEGVLMRLLTHAHDALPPDGTAIRELTEAAPYLTLPYLSALQAYALEPERRVTMMLLLADQAVQREDLSEAFADILLSLCCAPDDDLRAEAAKVVSEQLCEAHVAKHVRDFVEALLRSLALPPRAPVTAGAGTESASAEESEPTLAESEPNPDEPVVIDTTSGGGIEEGELGEVEDDGSASAQLARLLSSGPVDVLECSHRLDLYKRMCVKDATLLSFAIEVYGDLPPLFKRSFMQELKDLVKLITKLRGLREVLQMIDGYPPNAAYFVTHLISAAVDRTKFKSSRRTVSVAEVIPWLKAVKDGEGRSGDPRNLIPVLPLLPLDEINEIIPKLWNYPPDIMLLAVDRLLHTEKCPCPLPLPSLLLLILTQVPTQATSDTINGVTKSLMNDAKTFDMEVLRTTFEGMTSMDPIPRLTFRCLLLALTLRNSSTIVVIVQAMIDRVMSTKKPWLDDNAWKGCVTLIKQLLPGSCKLLCRVPTENLIRLLTAPEEAPLKAHFLKWLSTSSDITGGTDVEGLKLALDPPAPDVKPEPLEPAAPSDSKKRSAEDALLGREASAADGPVGTDGGAVDASAPEGEAAATELEANDEEEAPEVKRSRVGQ